MKVNTFIAVLISAHLTVFIADVEAEEKNQYQKIISSHKTKLCEDRSEFDVTIREKNGWLLTDVTQVLCSDVEEKKVFLKKMPYVRSYNATLPEGKRYKLGEAKESSELSLLFTGNTLSLVFVVNEIDRFDSYDTGETNGVLPIIAKQKESQSIEIFPGQSINVSGEFLYTITRR